MVAPPENLGVELRGVYRNSAMGFAFCALVLAGADIILAEYFRFAPRDSFDLLRFWMAAAVLTVLWVFVGFALVARGRRHSRADIQGSAFAPPSSSIAVFVAFLQNTVEQTLMAIVVQGAVLFIVGAATAPFVAAQVFLFAVGRIAFLVGYRKGAAGRAFGLAVTALPTFFGFVVAIFVLIETTFSR